MVVASVCRAALEGYVWVLLDGGPACAFSDSDITLMEDDLNILKDLFVADGEGLPRSLVEVESKSAHQILSLFSLDTRDVKLLPKAVRGAVKIRRTCRKKIHERITAVSG